LRRGMLAMENIREQLDALTADSAKKPSARS
jgi:hypothetical protein